MPPKRARKLRQTANVYEPAFRQYKWTFGEKKKLIAAIRLYGTSDLNKLAYYVKTKFPDQIERFLLKYKAATSKINNEPMVEPSKIFLNYETTSDGIPIDEWQKRCKKLLRFYPDYSRTYMQMLKKCSDKSTNFSEVYDVIIALMKNEIPPDFSPETSTTLMNLIDDLALAIQEMDPKEIMAQFATGNYGLEPPWKNSYSEAENKQNDTYEKCSISIKKKPSNSIKKETLSEEDLKKFILNPLSIPDELIDEVFNKSQKFINNVCDIASQSQGTAEIET